MDDAAASDNCRMSITVDETIEDTHSTRLCTFATLWHNHFCEPDDHD